jgi:hypothetical protein
LPRRSHLDAKLPRTHWSVHVVVHLSHAHDLARHALGAGPRWKIGAVLRHGLPTDDHSIGHNWTGPAFIYAADTTATDDVVFGEPRDLVLLGARSLDGLNLRIDPIRKILVDAGPVPSALATR